MAKVKAVVDSDGKVRVVDPRGGSTKVDMKDLSYYLSRDYTIQDPGQAWVDDEVKRNDGIVGGAKVFTKSLINQAAMGVPRIIREKTGDPLEVAAEQRIRDSHKIAGFTGGALGLGGSLAYGGPVWRGVGLAGKGVAKGAQKLLTRKIAGDTAKKGVVAGTRKLAARGIENAARFGTEGVAYSLPQGLTEAALADEGEDGFNLASEAILYGGLSGATLGIFGTAAKPIVKSVGKAGSSLSKHAGMARKPLSRMFSGEKAAASLVGMSESQANKAERLNPGFGKSLSRQLRDMNLGPTQVSKERLIKRISAEADELEKKAADLVAGVDGQVSKTQLGKELIGDIDSEIARFSRGTGNDSIITELNTLKKDITNKFIEQKKKSSILDAFGNPFSKTSGNETMTASEIYDWTRISKGKDFSTNEAKNAYYKAINKAKEKIAKMVEGANVGVDDAANLFRSTTRDYSTMITAKDYLIKYSPPDNIINFGGLGKITAAGFLAGPMGAGVATLLTSPALKRQRAYGLLRAEKDLKRVAAKIKDVPKSLDTATKRARERLPNVSRDQVMAGAMSLNQQRRESREDRLKRYETVRDNLAELSDMEYSFQHMKPVIDTLAETGAPRISQAVAQRNFLMSQYLGTQVPKSDSPDSVFKTDRYVPTDMELSTFEEKLKVYQDPFSVLEELGNGTLTKQSVDALQNLYPMIFERIKRALLNDLMENPRDLPYNIRVQLGLLLDMSTDETLENIVMYQSTYQGEDKPVKPGKMKDFKLPELETNITRIGNK